MEFLGHLLQSALEIHVIPVCKIPDGIKEKTGHRCVPMLQEDSAHKRLKSIGKQRWQLCSPCLRRPLPQQQDRTQTQPSREQGKRDGVHQCCPLLGEPTLLMVREPAKKMFCYNQFQYCVTQIFKPFIIRIEGGSCAVLICPGGVGHRLLEQLPVTKLQVEPVFQLQQCSFLFRKETYEAAPTFS